MAFLYLVTEIGGVMLAVTFHPESYGVGASCAGFGLIGFLTAYIFSNWQFMGRTNPGQRWYILVLCLFFFLTNQGLSLNWESKNIGHQGGFITGILIGFTLSEQYDYNAVSTDPPRTPDRYTDEEWKGPCCFKFRYYLCARCGLIFLIIWFVLLICLFYLYTDVDVE